MNSVVITIHIIGSRQWVSRSAAAVRNRHQCITIGPESRDRVIILHFVIIISVWRYNVRRTIQLWICLSRYVVGHWKTYNEIHLLNVRWRISKTLPHRIRYPKCFSHTYLARLLDSIHIRLLIILAHPVTEPGSFALDDHAIGTNLKLMLSLSGCF
jgi:hypothetical protein